MPKKIHDLADELDIKVDTLRKQIYTGKYLGKHYFKYIDHRTSRFNITEKDIITKIENGRKTKYLSDKLCDLIRLEYELSKEKEVYKPEDITDNITDLPIHSYSGKIIESIRSSLDKEKLSKNKKTRLIKKISMLSDIILNLETNSDLMNSLVLEIERAFDCKYGRLKSENILDELMLQISSYTEKFNNWEKGDYSELNYPIKEYNNLKKNYRKKLTEENEKDASQ